MKVTDTAITYNTGTDTVTTVTTTRELVIESNGVDLGGILFTATVLAAVFFTVKGWCGYTARFCLSLAVLYVMWGILYVRVTTGVKTTETPHKD